MGQPLPLYYQRLSWREVDPSTSYTDWNLQKDWIFSLEDISQFK